MEYPILFLDRPIKKKKSQQFLTDWSQKITSSRLSPGGLQLAMTLLHLGDAGGIALQQAFQICLAQVAGSDPVFRTGPTWNMLSNWPSEIAEHVV